jgi:hypothetical protein
VVGRTVGSPPNFSPISGRTRWSQVRWGRGGSGRAEPLPTTYHLPHTTARLAGHPRYSGFLYVALSPSHGRARPHQQLHRPSRGGGSHSALGDLGRARSQPVSAGGNHRPGPIRYGDGVVIAGDRQATEGHLVAHRYIQKVFPPIASRPWPSPARPDSPSRWCACSRSNSSTTRSWKGGGSPSTARPPSWPVSCAASCRWRSRAWWWSRSSPATTTSRIGGPALLLRRRRRSIRGA